MANIIQQQQDLEYFPDEQLISEAQQPSGRFPGYLVIAEVERRQEFRDRYNASQQAQQGEQPSIMEQAVEEFSGGIPSADPNFQGQPPGPQMAGGGKVPRYQSGLFVPPHPNPKTGKPYTKEELEEIERQRSLHPTAIPSGPGTVPVATTPPASATTLPPLSAEDIRGMADQSLGISEQDILSASGVTRDPSGGLAVTRRPGDQAAIDAAKARIERNQRQLDPTNPAGIAALANQIAVDTKTPGEYERELRKYAESLGPGSKDEGLELLRSYLPDKEKTSSRKRSTMLQGVGELILNLGHNNEAAFQALPAATREIEGIEDKYQDDTFQVEMAMLDRTESRQEKLLDSTAKMAGLKDARELRAFETQATYQRTQAALDASIRGDIETQQKVEQEEGEALQRAATAIVNLKQANLQSVIDVIQAVTNRLNSISQSELAQNAALRNQIDQDRVAADILKGEIARIASNYTLSRSDEGKKQIKEYTERLMAVLDKYSAAPTDPSDPAKLGIKPPI